jgi:hypothetical protein
MVVGGEQGGGVGKFPASFKIMHSAFRPMNGGNASIFEII